MAQDNFGLFGPSPEELRMAMQQQRDLETQRFAGLDPYRQLSEMAGSTGGMFNDALKSAFNVQDPGMKKAQDMKAIQDEIAKSGIDNELDMFKAAAMKLRERGYMKEAMQAATAYQKLAYDQSRQKKEEALADKYGQIAQGDLEQKALMAEWIKQRPTDASDQNAMKQWLMSAPPGIAEKIFPGVMPKMIGATGVQLSERDKARDKWLGKYDAMRESGIPLIKPSGVKQQEKQQMADLNRDGLLKDIADIQSAIESDPTLIGMVGKLRRGVETVRGTVESVGSPESMSDTPAQNLISAVMALMPRLTDFKDKGPLNKQDRIDLAKAIGDVESSLTSAPATLNALKRISAIMSRKKTGEIEEQSTLATDKTPTIETPEDVREWVKAGRITREEAKAILKDMDKRGLFK